jgi:hypothetical protein
MGERESREVEVHSSGATNVTPASAATCHPDVACPVCASRGKAIRMVPVKAHYECPECRYHDSCCM